MDDFLANKIIDDFMMGTMTAKEAWLNLEESREIISDEKYDEVCALITEQLIAAEMLLEEDDLELEDIFKEDLEASQDDLGWDEHPDWGSFDFED